MCHVIDDITAGNTFVSCLRGQGWQPASVDPFCFSAPWFFLGALLLKEIKQQQRNISTLHYSTQAITALESPAARLKVRSVIQSLNRIKSLTRSHSSWMRGRVQATQRTLLAVSFTEAQTKRQLVSCPVTARHLLCACHNPTRCPVPLPQPPCTSFWSCKVTHEELQISTTMEEKVLKISFTCTS